MSRFIWAFIALYCWGVLVGKALACETVIAPSNAPSSDLPTSWSSVTTSGSYATPLLTDNIYWEVDVQEITGVSCSSTPTSSDIGSRVYCTTIIYDDYSTPENEKTVRAIYADTYSLHCSIGYSLSSGQCYLTGECPAPEPELCSDGYPPEASLDIGYSIATCDRPTVKQCSDSSYVRDDIGICSTICTDYDSCYSYALTGSSCAGAEYFEFQYQDPLNFSFTCTTIDIASPDHPDNGGNSDGNPYNDPNTPTTGDGSVASSGEIDPYSLTGLIGNELQDDFSNIERAIRDNIDQSKTNTNTLEIAINGVADNTTAVESAIREGIISAEGNSAAIRQSIDTLSAELNYTGPCDPTQPDYYECLNTPLSNLPGHSSSNATTFDEANSNFKSRIDNASVVQAFSGISSILNLDNPQCPPFEIAFPAPINETISTTIHCDLMEIITPLISAVMIIVYTVVGFRIFASA